MDINRKEILKNICYTELVYGRINKKLGTDMGKREIEIKILDSVQNTPIEDFEKVGKNFYIHDHKEKMRITINSFTHRVITVDKLK